MRCVLLGLLVLAPSLVAGEETKARTPREEYEALLKDYEAAEAARPKGSRLTPADPLWIKRYEGEPIWAFAPRFLRFAEAHVEDPAAVDALLRIVDVPGSVRSIDKFLAPTIARAVQLLIRDHLQNERVVRACFAIRGGEGYHLEPYFRALLAKSRDREVVGWACLQLVRWNETRSKMAARPDFDHPDDHPEYVAASTFLNDRLDADFVKYIRATDPVALSAESEALLERVVEECGDLPRVPSWTDPKIKAMARVKADRLTLADVARPKLDALRSLAVGKVAPEIEGEDIDGKPMKLSEYRGKVVALVFWGAWCAPCMGLLPKEKALVERLEGRPFVLLGVNSDSGRERPKAVVAEKGITWRSWWDGGSPDGPIAARWDVHAWPTIIVLDREGVIRFKHVPHHVAGPLDAAVDSLMEESKP